MKHRIMNGTEDKLFAILFRSYTSLEKKIQQRISEISQPICTKCTSRCCKEEICRESIESNFLSILIKDQQIRYDPQNGWISPLGCGLSYGRPLVCYEFFCEQIEGSNKFQTSNMQQAVKEFVAIGSKAHGNAHLICVDNLGLISAGKIARINDRIGRLMAKLANAINIEGQGRCFSHSKSR